MDNRIEWLFPNNPIDLSVIREIENKITVVFPDDYVECVKDNHGGTPDLEVFDFVGHKEAVFNILLSFDPKSKSYILDIYNATRGRLANNVIPFANDPFGNLICFMFEEDNKTLNSIVFWDHENIGANKNSGVSKICNTFSKLLSLLYNPE